jgi:hypothetical protein
MQVEDIYRPPEADLEVRTEAQPQALAPFFQTSPLKVALLSLATLGLYQLYWFYKHWERRRTHGEEVSPLARTIFAVLFAHSLFQSVTRKIEHRTTLGVPLAGVAIEPLSAGALALGYFFLNVVWRLPDPASFVGLLSFLPLAAAQKRINQLHADMGLDPNEGSAFTRGTVVALAIGVLWWGLALIGIFMPEG